MERQEKGKGETSGGYEDGTWAVVSAAESYSPSLSTRHSENTVDADERIKKGRKVDTWDVRGDELNDGGKELQSQLFFYCGTFLCCSASERQTEMAEI